MQIEGFSYIVTTLMLAKDLHDIGRLDIIGEFFDELCYDSYYDSIQSVMSYIFTGFNCLYNEDCETELMVFEDKLISSYFVKAWDYGRVNKIPHDQNPFVLKAQAEFKKWLDYSYCVDYKLLAYTKTKRAAKKSKLLVSINNGCERNCQEGVAFGLIQLYKFFDEEVNGVRLPDDAPLPGQLTLDEVKEMMAA